MKKILFCSECGDPYPNANAWPRRCINKDCRDETFPRLDPVAALLQPVRDSIGRIGLIIGRRCINPSKGQYALPAGFIESHETGAEACVRELREELGIDVSNHSPIFHYEMNTQHGQLLSFYKIQHILSQSDISDWTPSVESDDLQLIYKNCGIPVCFNSHQFAIDLWFKNDYSLITDRSRF